MVAETRKQREIRLREEQILEVAREHLQAGGYLGLNMDRIAAQLEYSKGTLYQHFPNKEEILLALANEAMLKRVAMFERATAGDRPSRLRMAAVGAAAESFVEQFPHHFMVEQIVRASSIWEKTSDERRAILETCERRCMATTAGVVRDAMSAGDLVLTGSDAAEVVIFGLWSMAFGAQTIASSSPVLAEIGVSDPRDALRSGWNHLLDGYRRRPLSTEFDYSAFMDGVKQELFAHA